MFIDTRYIIIRDKGATMNKDIKTQGVKLFDSIKQTDDQGIEYWSARELAKVLDYSWEGFERVITRAKVSIMQTGMDVENHIRHVSKMVTVGYGNNRATTDYELTRYACYIIAQNGNAAKKPSIAAAQAYFAYQTRKQELSEQAKYDFERIIARQKFSESDKRISDAIIEKGMAPEAIAPIKSSGDKKLFGGKSTKLMKVQYGITNPKKPLADKAPNVVLAAKSLANEMTTTNLESRPIDTFEDILEENDSNNDEVRKTLIKRGIVPEELPPAEDTDNIIKRLKNADKKAIED